MDEGVLRKVDGSHWKWRPSWLALGVSVFIVGVYLAAVITTAVFTHADSLGSSWELQDLKTPFFYTASVSFKTSLICVALAPLFAWAVGFLSPRAHWSQHLLVVPYCLPTVAVGGILVLAFGNNGILNRFLVTNNGLLAEPLRFLYRDDSPLLGTVWMNLSFGVFLLMSQWRRIPREIHFEISSMGLSGWTRFRYFVFPYAVATLVPYAVVVFLSCFNSFGLMLMLSGTPRATTLELATWQALFLEGNWSKAGAFMALQLISSAALILVWGRILKSGNADLGLRLDDGSFVSPKRGTFSLVSVTAWLVVVMLMLFYAVPILALIEGVATLMFGGGGSIDSIALARAVMESGKNAVVAGALVTGMTLILVPNELRATGFGRRKTAAWLSSVPWLPFVVPGMVVSFAVMAISYQMDANWGRRIFLWVIQALSVLPLAALMFQGGWKESLGLRATLREEVGLPAKTFFWCVELPALSRSLGLIFVLGVALSVSDVTAVSLLGDPERPTLTVLIAQLNGSYQFAEAGLAVAILIGLSAAAMLLSSGKLRRRNA